MLKRFTRKLILVSAVVFILGAVSFTPASSTNRILICFEIPLSAECPTGLMCCDTVSGTCQCGG